MRQCPNLLRASYWKKYLKWLSYPANWFQSLMWEWELKYWACKVPDWVRKVKDPFESWKGFMERSKRVTDGEGSWSFVEIISVTATAIAPWRVCTMINGNNLSSWIATNRLWSWLSHITYYLFLFYFLDLTRPILNLYHTFLLCCK